MSSNSEPESGTPAPKEDSFPAPKIENASFWSRFVGGNGTRLWWLTFIALVTSASLISTSTQERGTTIRLRFDEGHGLKEGDELRHRGIAVGIVESVSLQPDFGGIEVAISLEASADAIANAESRFWIERPQLGLGGVRGLDTVVGPRYVQVVPGPSTAGKATEFLGLESPLTLTESNDVEITIAFNQGHGLSVGDKVRHLGIAIGEITAVDLDSSLGRVVVEARLVEGARAFARSGTKFWIERPQLSLQRIRGLDTFVSGRYLGVVPGPEGSPKLLRFEGLSEAPAADRPPGGVEILLESSRAEGLDRGIPLTYRGIAIGHVVSVGLATDARKVEARAYVRAPFRQLIRENTRFAKSSGFDVNVGWSG
ncbi:MAG: MlaD family protein, partial [Planctomycetota bacterium]